MTITEISELYKYFPHPHPYHIYLSFHWFLFHPFLASITFLSLLLSLFTLNLYSSYRLPTCPFLFQHLITSFFIHSILTISPISPLNLLFLKSSSENMSLLPALWYKVLGANVAVAMSGGGLATFPWDSNRVVTASARYLPGYGSRRTDSRHIQVKPGGVGFFQPWTYKNTPWFVRSMKVPVNLKTWGRVSDLLPRNPPQASPRILTGEEWV